MVRLKLDECDYSQNKHRHKLVAGTVIKHICQCNKLTCIAETLFIVIWFELGLTVFDCVQSCSTMVGRVVYWILGTLGVPPSDSGK